MFCGGVFACVYWCAVYVLIVCVFTCVPVFVHGCVRGMCDLVRACHFFWPELSGCLESRVRGCRKKERRG